MYEYLQKGLQLTSAKKIVRFSYRFTEDAEKIIEDESSEFGRRLTQAMIVLVNEICATPKVSLTLSELRDLAIRPCSLYFQEKRKISAKVLNFRMRQLCLVAVICAQQKGIGTVISTRNFHSQRYMLIKHPHSFFSTRPSIRDGILSLHTEINTEPDYIEDVANQQEYLLELKPTIPSKAFLLFQELQLTEVISQERTPYFRVDIALVGKMVKITNFEEMVEKAFKIENVGHHKALKPSVLFGIKPPLLPEVVHTSNSERKLNRVNEPLRPHLGSKDAIEISRPIEDRLSDTEVRHARESTVQSMRMRSSPLASSESSLVLVGQARKKRKLASTSELENINKGDYTVCFSGCLEQRQWSDEMVNCESVDQCKSDAPFGLFHPSCWGEVSDSKGLCKFCVDSYRDLQDRN